MAVLTILKRKAHTVVAPLLGASFVAYFAYHAVHGDRGLLAYLQVQQEIRKAEITRDLIHAERETLEKRVALMRPDQLDPDLLEERARVLLNFGRKDEVQIMLQRPQSLPPEITTN
ncbi:FtsB family cell division protein [Elstera cyanobacteriorum]|uniref:FtsB family cell division protein n=1 Tax=Elstera cyanobacteriorum TaxID=2022747 RepID=UPI0014827425|nr:septum formation initiator family protein [Elstera cyanobacteriorum]MCK6442117.1 septum formation initiator family protein [Elstera cyanobacteriorum]GFZ77945.1 septum formation initiator [Elstera cyanobacteriorum]